MGADVEVRLVRVVRILRLSLCAVTLAVASGCGSSASEPAGAELSQASAYASIPGYEISESPGACPVLSSEGVNLMDGCIAPPRLPLRMYGNTPKGVWLFGPFPTPGAVADVPAKLLDSSDHYVLVQIPTGMDYREIVIRLQSSEGEKVCAVTEIRVDCR